MKQKLLGKSDQLRHNDVTWETRDPREIPRLEDLVNLRRLGYFGPDARGCR